MLEKLQIEIDTSAAKCWKSSIMNAKACWLWLGFLVAVLLGSCAPMAQRSPGVSVSEVAQAGNRSGDFAITRNQIDSMLNNPKRPGLATGWGDAKKSSIRFVEFTRSSSEPAGTDRIYYDDKQGIESMARTPRKVKPLQKAAGGLVEWGIKGGWGYMPTYEDHRLGRRFVAGRKGGHYSIMVKNLSDSPLEVVCSVDGLDVQDGKSAAYAKRGYLIDPDRTLEIEGFRTSRNKVAQFEFSAVDQSYANLKHGNTRNVGVIGLAVFTPKGMRDWATAPDGSVRAAASPFAEEP